MFSFARVIDNTEFEKTGRIVVRLLNKSNSFDMQDLSNRPKNFEVNASTWQTSDETIVKFRDSYAYVANMFGGGFDYGTFYLPQVNSVGIVGDVGNTIDCPLVWFGGVNIPVDDRGEIDFKTYSNSYQINCASPDNEQNWQSDKNGVQDSSFSDTNVNGALIIKNKHTEPVQNYDDPSEGSEKRDFRLLPPENVVVMDRDKTYIAYNTIGQKDDEITVDGIATITMSKEKGIDFEYSKSTDDQTRHLDINIDQDGRLHILQDQDENKSALITIDTDDKGIMSVISDGKSSTTTVEQTYDTVTLNSKTSEKSYITLTMKGDEMNIDTPGSVNINANKGVNCGSLGQKVLLCPDVSLLPSGTFDGHSILVGNISIPVSDRLTA